MVGAAPVLFPILGDESQPQLIQPGQRPRAVLRSQPRRSVNVAAGARGFGVVTSVYPLASTDTFTVSVLDNVTTRSMRRGHSTEWSPSLRNATCSKGDT